jgi:uncharacterized protein (TIGR02217 family)
MYWKATVEDQTDKTFIRRFTPRYWTVDFSRPMMASVVAKAPDQMKLDLIFYRKEDLCGLIWESVDHYDHPLLKYETSKDYSDCTLSFRWRSVGAAALDTLHGPVLTVEGRDAAGADKTWYVRLWNYATGTGKDAVITFNFDSLKGGFSLPADADPLYVKDIDRMFISIVPPEYDGVTSGALAAAQEASVEVTDIQIGGTSATLKIGDAHVKNHPLRMANGYDDTYNLTPERVIWNMIQLGYSGWINHYVGMSHYYNLKWDAALARYIIDLSKAPLNVAAAAWHRNYFERAKFFDYKIIISLSYEIFAENIPEDWQQRSHNGKGARTGWLPPSSLIAPTNTVALRYLGDVFLNFQNLQIAIGAEHYYQIGEPWWWVSSEAPKVPHFYDDVTTALYTAETGQSLPAKHLLATEIPNAPQEAYLDWLGGKLGTSTIWLKDYIKAGKSSSKVGLLFYTPQVLENTMPMLERANYPKSYWVSPVFDFFQIENYAHVIAGNWAAHQKSLVKIADELGYSESKTHYFTGFNLLSETPEIWRNMDIAAKDAFDKNFAEVFIWAYPQIMRDGIIYNQDQEQEMSGFHEIRFPLDISYGAMGGPEFSTDVVEMLSGYEQRNRKWAAPKLKFNIGIGMRSEDDLSEVLHFFRARAGRAYGFRYRDWMDYQAQNEFIGTGNGLITEFQLQKKYSSGGYTEMRLIKKPVTSTVKIYVDAVEVSSGWSLDSTSGKVVFDVSPEIGKTITANFEFDVAVRFAEDHLEITLESFRAGHIPDISLIEVRL